MEQTFNIPLPLDGNGAPNVTTITIASGGSIVIVGANGSGKTRLAAHLEETLSDSHRIPAQRSIRMQDVVNVRDFSVAIKELHYGHYQDVNRRGHRWHNLPATTPIDDFERLLIALYSEQNNALLKDYKLRIGGSPQPLPETRLRTLEKLWGELLSHRKLEVKDASIKVRAPNIPLSELPPNGEYPASEMSDGERAIFYLIGQCLLAPKNGIIIVDEPELHLHQSLSSRLWDALEAAREDCAYIYVTHDIDFAVDRVTAQKFFVRSIRANSRWDIEPIPVDTGLPEHVVIELVGNRKPVLFIEGQAGSLDGLIYGSFYTGIKIEPMGSCENVIHGVSSFRANSTLHRLGTVYGCIDADHRGFGQSLIMKKKGIFILPVVEIENIFLLPNVFLEIASILSFTKIKADELLSELKSEVFASAQKEAEAIATRYAARKLDRLLKHVTVDRADPNTFAASFTEQVSKIDPAKLIAEFSEKLTTATSSENYEEVLRLYDQKGLLSFAGRKVGIPGPKELVRLVSRTLLDDKGLKLRNALSSVLPVIPADAKP
jgi:energy-coupling factor transporter ATP-binding protein EcfA2